MLWHLIMVNIQCEASKGCEGGTSSQSVTSVITWFETFQCIMSFLYPSDTEWEATVRKKLFSLGTTGSFKCQQVATTSQSLT